MSYRNNSDCYSGDIDAFYVEKLAPSPYKKLTSEVCMPAIEANKIQEILR